MWFAHVVCDFGVQLLILPLLVAAIAFILNEACPVFTDVVDELQVRRTDERVDCGIEEGGGPVIADVSKDAMEDVRVIATQQGKEHGPWGRFYGTARVGPVD